MEYSQKVKLVEDHWGLFPLGGRLPDELKKIVDKKYGKSTARETIISSLNNLYFRLMKKRSCTHGDLFHQSQALRYEAHLPFKMTID